MPSSPSDAFHRLRLADLLEARDAYHVHLANLRNVVATAVGKSRVHLADDTRLDFDPQRQAPEKTLANTAVQPWSWPCVLVFVGSWAERAALPYDQIVPPLLYLPDGRKVPTCVVKVDVARVPDPAVAPTFPAGLAGGGFPVLSEVQGEDRIGSVACLVSDGDRFFALTNRHVAGPAGRIAYVVAEGKRKRVGCSAGRDVGKLPLSELHGWPGASALVNLDAGLVEIDDLAEWTSQVYGVGELGDPVDLNAATFGLDLIGQRVKAFGAASGRLEGEIHGLFFRYRTQGGADYLAELFIGPRAGASTVPTRHGDSGTLWFLDEGEGRPGAHRAVAHRPIALQWGGSAFGDGADPHRFALASALSSVCRTLDVELVRDWRLGLSETWGKVGHYKIGALACDLVRDAQLGKLMQANKLAIGVSDESLEAGDLPKMNQDRFVALADVPDLVWRTTRKKDEANHFADMDQPGEGEFAGKTLLQLWQGGRRDPAAWTAFYDALDVAEDRHRGALPFRVWQIYEALVGFAKDGELAGFVAAAGVLAHYVGDASQPLHVSFLHHGRPGVAGEDKVHSVYETAMLDRKAAELVSLVGEKLAAAPRPKPFTGGARAADAAVALMDRALARVPPMEIIDAFDEQRGRGQVDLMWSRLGERTAELVVDGASTLAAIWQSAWVEGGGKLRNGRLRIPEQTLRKLYLDSSFLEAAWLKDLAASGGHLRIAKAGNGAHRTNGATRPPPHRRRPARGGAERRAERRAVHG